MCRRSGGGKRRKRGAPAESLRVDPCLGGLADEHPHHRDGSAFQEVEKKAYPGEKRPWWFHLGLVAFAALYLTALAGFVMAEERTWAAWVLMVVIPVGAALKLGLVILNDKGKERVTSIEGDSAWRKIALARAVLIPVFLALAYFV